MPSALSFTCRAVEQVVGLECKLDDWVDDWDDWDDSGRQPEDPRNAGTERRQKIRRRGGGCLPESSQSSQSSTQSSNLHSKPSF